MAEFQRIQETVRPFAENYVPAAHTVNEAGTPVTRSHGRKPGNLDPSRYPMAAQRDNHGNQAFVHSACGQNTV